MLAQVPIGVIPGPDHSRFANTIRNPYEGQASAVQQGKQLLQTMNCAYFHAFGAVGLMGPSLADKPRRCGGTPGQIFKSVFEGRSKGMPAYGGILPASVIWQIVAYIESLGGSTPVEH